MKRLLCVGMCLMLVACGDGDKSVKHQDREVVIMDVDDVYNNAIENPFAFEEALAGKSIKLVGSVKSIMKSPVDGRPMIGFKYVDLDNKYKNLVIKPNVFAILDSEKEAASLVVGSSLILLCNDVNTSTLTRYNAIRFDNCKIDTQ